MTIQEDIANRIAAGLKRRSIASCSKWSTMYRMIGGNSFPGLFKFKYHPWLKEMHDCDAERIVGQKAAQMGYSEAAINKCFYTIDIAKNSVLYVFPSLSGASEFSATRFDGALELSPHIDKMFDSVKNVQIKRAKCGATLYLAGSNSREALKSKPVSLTICDEVEEMNQENITLIPERMAGQKKSQWFLLSTPSIPGYGINSYYEDSTQDHFFFKCPHCNRFIELTWPDCVCITAENISDPRIRDTYYFCPRCKGILSHEDKVNWLTLDNTEWVKAHPDSWIRGFHINQMYSPTMPPWGMAEKYIKGKSNEAEEVDFWNSKLGLPFVQKGAKVTDEDIAKCVRNYSRFDPATKQGFLTLGCDVGKVLHYEIDQWYIDDNSVASRDINQVAKCKLVRVGEVDTFDQLRALILEYNVDFCVIDKFPEVRATKELAMAFPNRVRRCYYPEGVSSGDLVLKPDRDEALVAADRSSWLDLSLGRFIKDGYMMIPRDTPEEYKTMIKALTKTYKRDQWGKLKARHVKRDKDPDHYAHARTYSEIALRIAVTLSRNQNAEGVI